MADPRLKNFGRRLLTGLLLAGLFAFLALRQPQADGRLLQRDLLAMGTLVTVTVYRDDSLSPAAAERALDDLAGFLQDFETTWSVLGGGALAQLNAGLARGESVSIPPELAPLFQRAAQYTRQSGGRFDVRVGPLVQLWGFDDESRYRQTPPDPAAVARRVDALRQAPQLGADARYGPAPEVQFDFGAIAKGEACDLAIARLRAAGVRNAIVNLGGNLRVSGQKGDTPWNIGIRHPRPDPAGNAGLLATLPTHGDEAIITSGDYERYFEFEGQRYHHILDPRSGQPARGLQSVTVISRDGALGDAASTALFVAGPQWRETAREMELDQVLAVDEAGQVWVTPALAARLQLRDGITATPAP
ncbi:MAG: FAD:protein FMN transferase [Gammaproteobacteria bacterium]